MAAWRIGFASMLLAYAGLAPAVFSPPVTAREGMVVSDHYLASRVGASILKQGGNAMDAAVAVGYALAVVHPCCGNIGGGGFMLVHWHTGEELVLDFRETAPSQIKKTLFFDQAHHLKPDAELGYLYVGVPGTVMGLNTALSRFGTMTLAQVMAPAIELAEQGFVLNRYDLKNFLKAEQEILAQPNVSQIMRPQGRWPRPGERWIQPALATTLKKIRDQGTAVFYQGEIAAAIVAASAQDHGVLSLDDFAHYQVYWRQPVRCQYRGYQVVSAPPPSSGTIVCEILRLLEPFPVARLGFHAALTTHYNAAAMKQAFYDRNHYLGDPAFVKDASDWLLSDKRLAKLQRRLQVQRNRPVWHHKPANTSLHTTHYVVMDKDKNVVSTTYTVNSYFGSVRIAGETGFFLNNDLKDFALEADQPNLFFLVQSTNNVIEPNKRPLSSMSPSLVLKDGQVLMALGAAGGPTIITSLVEALENVIDFGMDIRAASDSARYHMQWEPDVIYMEPYAFSPDTISLLQRMGYRLQENLFDRYLYWGQMASLLVEPNGVIDGASDNRHPNGRAVGVLTVNRIKSKQHALAWLQ